MKWKLLEMVKWRCLVMLDMYQTLRIIWFHMEDLIQVVVNIKQKVELW
jgi:hypothetical protein